jgi:DNA-binding ferritin-like protein
MTMKTAKAALTRNDKQLSDSLNQVLADSYALLSLTHLAHWNVEGPSFFDLHTAFQLNRRSCSSRLLRLLNGFVRWAPMLSVA